MTREPIVELRNCHKYFPGIKALAGVGMTIRTGEVHALIGENGAGKSTLVKVLTGVHQPTSGEIVVRGTPTTFVSPQDSAAAGIVAIHQEASMFPELTVTENIFLGHPIRNRWGLLDWKQMTTRARELLQRLEIAIDVTQPVRALSTAQRHTVEIAKALSHDASVLIMDEPTSALSLHEVEELYKVIRRLRDQGVAIVFISHKFDEIRAISDTYTVLRDGAYVGSGEISDTTDNELVRMMVGRSLDQLFPKSDTEPGEVVLEATGLTRAGYFRDVSFSLRRGEILGFFGLIGAGRSEVMRGIFGIDQLDAGTVTLAGTDITGVGPTRCMELGIALVPEDRQNQGAILDMTIRHNITLPSLAGLSGAPVGTLRTAAERTLVEEYGTKMEVRAASWDQLVTELSGGNQQKVVLAKWLATRPTILILDEPTKGIDVATKARVHEFMSELAAAGMAIAMVSSELPEVMGMCDRVIVMHEGHMSGEFRRDALTAEEIMAAATGGLTTGGHAS